MKLDFDFHVHTNFTDSSMGVGDIARRAGELRLRKIAITEHVRKKMNYDYSMLLGEIKKENRISGTVMIPGVEAKILPDGSLDCPPELLKSKIIIGSVHSLGGMAKEKAYRLLLDSECHVIGHPTGFPVELLPSCSKALELNEKYPLPMDFVEACIDNKIMLSIGSDAHSADMLGKYTWVLDAVKKFSVDIKIWEPR
jgi:putative hydrolase